MPASFSKNTLGLILSGAAIPLVAHAEIYLTEEQAVKAIYPNPSSAFVRKKLVLTDEQKKKIEDLSKETVRNKDLVIWVNQQKDVIFIDQVLGKHEFITYAGGIDHDGKIKSLEIMEYRETYGQQVREEKWRKQFFGKDSKAELKLNQDIVNLSGATLSSSHIAGGMRRLLHTYEAIRGQL